jgi:hypothetical protein
MLDSKGEKSVAAIKRIYELCDVGHKQNRVPMVCTTGKHDVLTPLAKFLARESGNGLHLAILALNNLSIPTENKSVMALGPVSKLLIGGLCKVIAEDNKETYLCCICLMNLSFLEASATRILRHSPSEDGKDIGPLDNPDSLLRVLEKLLTDSPAVPKLESGKSERVRWACSSIKNLSRSEENAAMIGKTDISNCAVENIRATTAPPSRWTSFFATSIVRGIEKLLANSPAVPKSGSGKSEGVHWACGLIRNLAKSEENAALIGKTDIPKCVVENIRATTAPPSHWTSNSLEDYSLFIILELSQWPVSREALIRAGALDVIKSIMSEGGRQGLKATLACAFLGASLADFPDGGNPAAESVSELMANIVEKKGKDGQYDDGVFKLYTAAKAYRDLAKAAAKADGEGGEFHTKTLAFPCAVALNLQIISVVALNLQIISDLVISADVCEAMSAEYAIGAIEAMLPAILEAADPPRKSVESEKAAGEISQMLLTYANVAGTTSQAQSSARNTAAKIKEASGSARPILETSHDLWTQYRKREGQPLALFHLS